MAVQIPIISDFDGTGVKKAVKQFKELEGAGKKAQFALKKAAVPAAAALAGITAVLVSGTKAAIDDAAAQRELARQLMISTDASDDQIASVERWITTQGKLLGVADDDLRPALAKLARATYDIGTAQRAVSLAMDISAATGKDLGTVTTALEKAYGGNLSALGKLLPSVRSMIKDGASLEEVMDALGGTFGGAATEAANTAQGSFRRFNLAISETKESIGAALLPIIEKALPVLNRFSQWAQDNPETFIAIAAAISGVAAAIMAVNVAMALNPFTAIAAGIVVLDVAIVAAYKKFEWFRKGVNVVINGIIGYFEALVNSWITVMNAVIRAWNIVPGHKDISTLDRVSFGRVGEDAKQASAGGVLKMATGGIVTSPTLALIGEAGPEAVVPLNKAGAMGNNINVYVTSADPRAVVDALVRYNRQSGAIPIAVAG